MYPTGLRETGRVGLNYGKSENNSTFGAQFNNIQRRGGRTTKHSACVELPLGCPIPTTQRPRRELPRNFRSQIQQRLCFHGIRPYIEFCQIHTASSVQNGRNLTLKAPAPTTTVVPTPHTASCITDGAANEFLRLFPEQHVPVRPDHRYAEKRPRYRS